MEITKVYARKNKISADRDFIYELPYLPNDILSEIAICLTNHSLNSTANFILSSKSGKEAVLNRLFYKRANLNSFISNPRLIDKFNNFFNNCLTSNNPQALYLYGLKLLSIDHNIDDAWSFVISSARYGHKGGIIMTAIIYCCKGLDEYGEYILDRQYKSWRKNVHELSHIANNLQVTLLKLIKQMTGLFQSS